MSPRSFKPDSSLDSLNLTWSALSRLSKGLRVPRWVLVKRVDGSGRG